MTSHARRLFPLLALALWAGSAFAIPMRNIELKANFNDYPPGPGAPFGAGYAACWAYVHEDGREYAVIGVTTGTAIYNVTDPDNVHFVGLIAGPYSAWREMKQYRNWIYISTESNNAPDPGIQIVRMTDPENPLLVGTYTVGFNRTHTVSVDTTRALLYCNGTSLTGSQTGLRILSLADPEAPVELSWWPGGALPVSYDDYVHDSVPIGNRLYASSIYSGIERVIDVTDPSAPSEVASWTYPGWTETGAFTHNSWPDATGNWLYATDEVQGEPLKIFDISNLAAPVLVNNITSNPGAIVHNAHVMGDELYLSNYTEGIRVLDISDPAHPAEFAWADSYPGASGGFFGVWEVCPFFPSGTIIASDMQTGLYVYRLQRDYGILRAKVVDASTLLPMEGVDVVLETLGDSLSSPADGIVQFAPGPGVHTVRAHRFGYEDATATYAVSIGSRDTFELALALKPTVDVDGTVRDANTLAALDEANVTLRYTPLHEHTDLAGQYLLAGVPDDLYRVEIARPGYVPIAHDRRLGPDFSSTVDYQMLPAATWDDFDAPSGWTVGAAGDDATSGVWVRVEPLGTGLAAGTNPRLRGGDGEASASVESQALGRTPGTLHDSPEQPVAPGDVQPEYDSTPPPGTMCFVTGQGSNPSNTGEADVDNGHTTLTSPDMDLSAMTDPMIGYWRWFYANGDENDWLAVLVSNDGGTNWTAVDSVRGVHNHWEQETFRVADFVTPTSQVRLRFVAADEGSGSLVEAAIDDVVTFEAGVAFAPVAVDPTAAPRTLRFRAPWPNPAHDLVRLSLELPQAGEVEVTILDLAGRRMRTLHRGPAAAGTLELEWHGDDARGTSVRGGVYYAVARAGDRRAVTRFVRLR